MGNPRQNLEQNLATESARARSYTSITLHGLKVNHEPKSKCARNKQSIVFQTGRLTCGNLIKLVLTCECLLENCLTDLEFLEHIENSLINSIYQTSTLSHSYVLTMFLSRLYRNPTVILYKIIESMKTSFSSREAATQ